MSFDNPTTTIAGSDITGKISGNTVETSPTAPRMAMNDPAYPNELIIQSGQANETRPAELLAVVPSGVQASTALRSPAMDGGSQAAIGLTADAASNGGLTHAQIDAHEIILNNFTDAAWRMPRTVYKTADTTINNSTALATDPALAFAGIYTGTYAVEALILYSSSAVANWKGFLTATGSITDRLLLVQRDPLGGGTTYGVSEGAVTFTANGAGVGTKRAIRIVGTFKATADGQAFNLQWAQNTAEATNTVVHKGSYYRIQRIA